MLRGGYIGPAPVPLHVYSKIVGMQTVHGRAITKSAMRSAFEGVVLEEALLDRLGPSLNSGRAIFVYGPAGTGKTYIAQKLKRLFYDRTLIPHAISVNESIISVFDPIIHRAASRESVGPELRLETGHDPRFVCCERPVVMAGGELTTDMLEVQYDSAAREYRAPLQLKANNGMFVIDDMGRQKVAPEAIFNRWIVPMEEKKDYLSLGSGRHFSVPFDVVLIFSTNMHPLDLADEAFLRRIGYKIGFDYLTRDQYRQIWKDACREYGIVFDPETLEFVLTELHEKESVRLLPCHPRDLLGIAVDLATYLDEPRRLTKQQLRWAWSNYFVSLKNANGVGA
jgi:SpoVK/Ycf46/Vps4 family AAA+-type ATPase